MLTPVLTQSLVNANNLTSDNPRITVQPEQFYTSSQRTARQAAAAQCFKQAPINASVPSTSSTTVNVSSTNSNLNQNIQDMDTLPFRLGWLLGFRATTLAQLSVTVANTSGTVTAPAMMDLNGPRYLYLVVDEYNNSFPNTFLCPQNQYLMNKKVLARISVDPQIHPFGTVLTGNEANGVLISDQRTYSGKIDIQRLNIQLVNEWGMPVNLNGLDFSFVLEIEYE
jgi:hypothetical protein